MLSPRLLFRTGIRRPFPAAIAVPEHAHPLTTSKTAELSSSIQRCTAAIPRVAPSTSPSGASILVRHLSSDSSGPEDLSAILAREIDEEVAAGSTTMPDDLADLKQHLESVWRIVDGSGPSSSSAATVKMFKKEPILGGAKVVVSFHCQDTLADDDEVDYEDEDGEEAAAAVRFRVNVGRAGKTMVLTCIAEEGTATVESVAMAEGEGESTAEGVEESLYQGPEFSELAEDLQEAFHSYVQTECGIDGDVAAFISMYADHREQVEYVDWMKGVQKMIQ